MVMSSDVLIFRVKMVDIAPDWSGYLVNIFLISPQKHMLWVLIRNT